VKIAADEELAGLVEALELYHRRPEMPELRRLRAGR
jgi:hypothetical protein